MFDNRKKNRKHHAKANASVTHDALGMPVKSSDCQREQRPVVSPRAYAYVNTLNVFISTLFYGKTFIHGSAPFLSMDPEVNDSLLLRPRQKIHTLHEYVHFVVDKLCGTAVNHRLEEDVLEFAEYFNDISFTINDQEECFPEFADMVDIANQFFHSTSGHYLALYHGSQAVCNIVNNATVWKIISEAAEQVCTNGKMEAKDVDSIAASALLTRPIVNFEVEKCVVQLSGLKNHSSHICLVAA